MKKQFALFGALVLAVMLAGCPEPDDEPDPPPAPQNVTVSQVPNFVFLDVKWDAVPGVTEYHIYRKAHNSVYVPDPEAITTEPEYLDIDYLDKNTKYCYQITAVANGVESAKSTEASATTFDGFSRLSVDAYLWTSTNAIIKWDGIWDGISWANYYEVYRSSTYNGEYKFIGGHLHYGWRSGAQYFTDPDCVPYTSYYYKVMAFNVDLETGTPLGASSLSAGMGVSTLRLSTLSAPANVQAQAIEGPAIKLTWNAVAGATYYLIYYSNSENDPEEYPYYYLGGVAAPAVTVSDTAVEAGETWYYKVTTISGSSSNQMESVRSVVCSATVPGGSSSMYSPPSGAVPSFSRSFESGPAERFPGADSRYPHSLLK
jgi:fibronectin type 3 domain-containing protein